MDFEMIEIWNKKYKKGKDLYEFIIEEKWIEGWGVTHGKGRVRPKFYRIKENGELILHTSLWQTWKKYIRKIESK